MDMKGRVVLRCRPTHSSYKGCKDLTGLHPPWLSGTSLPPALQVSGARSQTSIGSRSSKPQVIDRVFRCSNRLRLSLERRCIWLCIRIGRQYLPSEGNVKYSKCSKIGCEVMLW